MGQESTAYSSDADKTREELARELKDLRNLYSRLKDVVRRYEKVAGKKDLYRSLYDLETERDRINELRDRLQEKQKEADLQDEELDVQREEIRANLEELNSHDTAAQARKAQLDDEARRLVAEAVAAERKRLFDVLETLPVMVCLLTPDYHVAFANRAFQEKFGEARGQRCYEYCGRRSEPCESCESYNVLKTGRPHHWELHGPDGSVIDTYDYPFTNVDSTPLILEMGIDITERRRAEEALREAQARAELYLDLMGHDINNMNQVSQGYLEIAIEALKENGKIEVKDAELLEKPLQSIQDSTRLIENVRKLRAATTREHQLQSIDLNEILKGIQEQYSKANGRHVTINYTPTECHILATGLVKDVFTNLVGNAIKHSDPDKPIVIDIGQTHIYGADESYYKVKVEDNGPGIPDELKPRIFNRFERGNTNAKGKGLGLYLVKTLVLEFNGKIWVEDRVQGDHTKGARFVVMLPAVGK